LGRRKKEPETIAINEIELENTPHNSFCFACQHSDLRIVKDNLNTAVLTINRICQELDIDKNTLNLKCKAIGSWIEEQKQFKILQAKKEKKLREKSKGDKSNG
jgi:hypothetical protein